MAILNTGLNWCGWMQMKEGDKVVLKSLHRGHNRNLRKHLGKTATIQFVNATHWKTEYNIKFDNGATFWVNGMWLKEVA